jgi:uncharacterized membrane protein
MLGALIAAPLTRKIDAWMGLTLLGHGKEGARAILQAFVTSSLTFTVFVFSLLLVVVQIASGQLTPRVVSIVLKDKPAKLTLGVFVFTFIYSVAVLGRVEDYIPQFQLFIAILLTLLSIGAFLYLIQYVSKNVRPASLINKVGSEGLYIIEKVHPNLIRESPEAQDRADNGEIGELFLTVYHIGDSGVVLAFDVDGLLDAALRGNCVIEMVPQVGEFVARGEPLFNLYNHTGTKIDQSKLQSSVAFGQERTMEQDPAFAFRILVDIASKALSPAINDPTTAVLAIDQIHRLLRMVGIRNLDDGVVRDYLGQIRLIYPTPNWEDYVSLAISEVRLFGAGSPQVDRRLRAMIENLIEILPEHRIAPLKRELDLINRLVEHEFIEPEDRISATTPDYQGFGGSTPAIKRRYKKHS